MSANKKKIGVILLIVFLLIPGIWYASELKKKARPEDPDIVIPTDPTDPEDPKEKADIDPVKYRELWLANKAINEDYIGQIVFPSGLIDLPVVQGYSNDEYLRKDWETGKYMEEGSIFLDSFHTLSDYNLTIYGHFVYKSLDPERTKMFTPLEKLTEKANYEDNKTVLLALEDEIRQYEIVLVFMCPLEADTNGDYVYTADDMQYYWANHGDGYFNYSDRTINENYFSDYINSAKGRACYKIDAEFSYEDHYLTLQTCVENHPELREIVLCKEVARIPYGS